MEEEFTSIRIKKINAKKLKKKALTRNESYDDILIRLCPDIFK